MEQFINITYVIRKEGKQYAALCPELGTASCGDTIDEAMSNLDEAVAVDLTTLEDLGECESFLRKRGVKLHTRQPATRKIPVNNGEMVYRKSLRIPAHA